MAEPRTRRRGIEQYDHPDKDRANNPPVGLVTPATDPDAGAKRTYAYDPHLDPSLQWAGKAEHTSFEVPTVSLHVHERIDPRTIIEAVRKRNGQPQAVGQQLSLFAAPRENPPIREAVEFYRHKHDWSNRLIAGDSLLVMNSLLEKEGLAGANDLPRPALRHPLRLQLSALCEQARCAGWPGRRPYPGAGDHPRLPGYMGGRYSLLPHLPSGPAAVGTRVVE